MSLLERALSCIKANKPRVEHYKLFLILQEDFTKVQEDLFEIAWYRGQDFKGYVLLFIPSKKIEYFIQVLTNLEIKPNLMNEDVIFSGIGLQNICTSLYERSIGREIREIYLEVRWKESDGYRDVAPTIIKINDALSRIDNIKDQFQDPNEFLSLARDESLSMSLSQIIYIFKGFNNVKR